MTWTCTFHLSPSKELLIMIIMLIIIIIIISEFLDQMQQVSSLGFMAFQSLRLCAVLIFSVLLHLFLFFSRMQS